MYEILNNETISQLTLLVNELDIADIEYEDSVAYACGCSGSCSGGCQGSCSGDCPGGCSGSCSGSCSWVKGGLGHK